MNMKRILVIILALVLLLLCVVTVRTMLVADRQITVEPAPPVAMDFERAAERLAGAIRYKTISYQENSRRSTVEFLRLHQYLEQAFPLVHKSLAKEVVNNYSLLYTWKGSSQKLKPIILLAHMDVVPAVVEGADDWKYPPFAGRVADGYIWGRGSMDDKLAMTGVFEALENLLEQGFEPQRTVYFAIGHDEEIGGRNGAARIADVLRERGVIAAFTLDEGSAIVEGIVPGVLKPVALIALAEKGYLSLELNAVGQGGHSSRPIHFTAIGKLARSIHRLETNLMPAELRAPASGIFEFLATQMPISLRVVAANRWLFDSVLMSRLERSATTNAIIRTTTAPTLIAKTGIKENVIPRRARAIVNFRILPGDSVQNVIDHVARVIDDRDVTVSKHGNYVEASPVSDIHAVEFKMLHRTIRQVFPEVVVAPGLVIGGTDSKHYVDITSNSFRFLPMYLSKGDLSRIHGKNERLSIKNYSGVIRFYIQLLRNFTGSKALQGKL